MVNVFDIEMEEGPGRDGFWFRAAALGATLGAARIGAGAYEARAGVPIWPYHYHYPDEEWLYVLDGRLRLRLGDTTHVLAPGDSAHFDSLTPHRLAAEDHDGVELLFVHTLLQSPTAALCLGPATGHPTPGETS